MAKPPDEITTMEEFENLVISYESNRLEANEGLLAQARAIEKRLREHPMSDEDAVKATVAFITFTPLGGE